ncbi:MAG: hypothetical protein HKN48_11785 [Flavobacteriaceae bacterium]|nr:hypothetical protein [Flavobacteriaceae bacterium]
MKVILFIFFGMSFGLSGFAQEFNQFDENGKRHGVWKKKFPKSDQLRYEGEFNHGKEVGTFKFYCEDCKTQPMVVKEFSKNDDISEVKYYTKKGKLVSEGKMEGKERIGEWVYYHEKANTVMTREFYSKGALDGKKSTYYLNNQLTEELNYKNGKREGPNNYYSPDGVLLKKLLYVNDNLHGPAEYYDANGNVTIKGQYLNGKKHGLWKYYKNGKVELEETYPKPRLRND